MSRVRRPAVSGLFYPDDPVELDRDVHALLELRAIPFSPDEFPWLAIQLSDAIAELTAASEKSSGRESKLPI